MRVPPGAWSRVAALLKTFLGEAAVLVLVFPILDRFVASGLRGVTVDLIVWSVAASTILLSGAIAIAVLQEADDGE